MQPVRHFLAFTAVTVLSLSLVACGGGKQGGDQGSAGSGSGGSSGQSQDHDQQVKYASCLRKKGLDVQDPEPGKGLALPQSDSPKAKKAMDACKEFSGGSSGDDPAQLSRQKDLLTKFARCMRKNGVDMPDPDAQGRLPGLGEKNEKTTKAVQICKGELGDMAGQ